MSFGGRRTSIFGVPGETTTQTATQQSPNPFGSTTMGAGGLFGSQNQQQQTQQPSLGGGLFGSQNQPNQQSTLGSGLFGQQNQPNQSNQQQQSGAGLFGQQNQQQQPTLGASFLGSQNNQQPTLGASMFGSQNNQQQQNTFGQPQQQPQQQSSSLFSGFGAPKPAQQPLGNTQTQNQQGSLGTSSLWQPGSTLQPREKTVPEQMHTLLEKWSPNSPSCVMQRYFYNHVQADTVPYYGPQADEDESKWEEALSNRPSEGDIPVQCRGFLALGERLKIQVGAVAALQQRLHEIHNSLTTMLQIHELDISIRTADARRKHIALTQRCIQLATKVQILQNRGYALDGSEEELKKKLVELEKKAFDPQLNGRQEEIWARMVGVRERSRFLQEETEKAGAAMAELNGEEVDETVLKKAKKILGDFETTISRLNEDVKEIGQELGDWEKTRQNGASVQR